MRQPIRSLTFVALSVGAAAGCGDGGQPGLPAKVLTWNLYLGAALEPLASAQAPDEVPAVAASAWAKVQASDFPARAEVLAARIADLAPDLVALQEVSLYRRQSPSDYHAGDAPNATEPALDFLALLMAQLDARGGGYRVASEAPNADNELPVADGAGGVFDLRLTDRDVILARDGVTTSNAAQTIFQAHFNFAAGGVGGVPLVFTRSLSHVDASVHDGAAFTFTTSHLEIGGLPAVQQAQAQELDAAVAALPGDMVLAGDFNSAPGASTYQLLTKTFRDPAAARPAPATDPTCCQAEDLKNAASSAGERIDLVLTRGPFGLTAGRPVGSDAAADRTPGGLWASDHFGYYAELTLSR